MEVGHSMLFTNIHLASFTGSICLIACISFGCSAPTAGHNKGLVNSPADQNVRKTSLTRTGAVPVQDIWYDVQFVSDRDCFLSTSKSLWRSSDEGKTWERIYSGDTYGQTIVKTYFVNSNVGWLETYDGWFQTGDRGRTWNPFVTPLSDPAGKLSGISFVKGGNVGWIFGATLRVGHKKELKYNDGTDRVLVPAIYRTIDRGMTWQSQSTPSTSGEIDALFALNEDDAVAIGIGGAFYTHDGGERWMRIHDVQNCLNADERVVYEGRLSSVFLLSDEIGWISFNDGRLL